MEMISQFEEKNSCSKGRSSNNDTSRTYLNNPSGKDGHRHVNTAPVRLHHAQNDDHERHKDGHFATATVHDKCKVPLGLPAAKIQEAMLIHMNYRIYLPHHDWIVAPRHQLIPSVYAACLLSEDGDLGYSGPTYIAIHSAKHDLSTADSYALDFNRLVSLKEFENVAHDETRFPKTLVASIKKFKKYNLDALFILTHASCDYFGSHLNNSSATINIDLEKLNFHKAGQILAEKWNQSVIDGFPCVAE
ncbi:unnamed protein product [Rotaria sordida]|uniref:Uncharacterized protein n=1 Tax=Rotaria sordida TaxID=392033 RepID=A0A816BXS2_9BILA|nr:unnamed protein product [Rotaria sordida]CAF1616433.1 unnamed protein product [Rotaria sordida]